MIAAALGSVVMVVVTGTSRILTSTCIIALQWSSFIRFVSLLFDGSGVGLVVLNRSSFFCYHRWSLIGRLFPHESV